MDLSFIHALNDSNEIYICPYFTKVLKQINVFSWELNPLTLVGLKSLLVVAYAVGFLIAEPGH